MNRSLKISYEFFPPKTAEGREHLTETAMLLKSTAPHLFSVTFGAGGSTKQGTIETVRLLQQQTDIQIAPHISCMGCERHEIIDLLSIYQSMGVRELIALRGDLPSGMGHSGEFKFADELVTLIRETTHQSFNIAVAAYPEIHPQAKNATADLMNLKRKYQAGANYAITQYFFNPDAYFRFLEDCEKAQIHFPIIPGIMPITQFHHLARFSDNCGAEIPRWLRKRLECYTEDSKSIEQFAFDVVLKLCERLIEGGAPGLHFYTLNKPHCIVLTKHLTLVTTEEKTVSDTQASSASFF